MKTNILCLVAILASPALFAGKPDDLIKSVMTEGAKYSAFGESAESKEMGRQGRMEELNQKLIRLVPDEKKTVVDYFVLGNMLYEMDPDRSYQLMLRALALSPDEPLIQYEVALQEHRKGSPAKALALYQRVTANKLSEDLPAMHALMADCYLRTGEYQRAFAAWKKAGHAEHHTAIDFAIHSVYGKDRPLMRRAGELKAIKGGALNRYGDLILHDVHWRKDWWNSSENTDFLNYDLARAEKELGANDPRFLELKLFLEVLRNDEMKPEAFLTELKKLGLWGERSRLPYFPQALYYFVKKLNEDKSAQPEAILKAYEGPLRERALGASGHDADLDVLAFLYAWTDSPKLDEIDRLGWKQRHLVKYAQSYVAGLHNNKRSEYAAELNAAVMEFPYSVELATMHLMQVYDTDQKFPAMAALAAAAFPGVEQQGDSYKLKSYILSFEHELEKASSGSAPNSRTAPK